MNIKRHALVAHYVEIKHTETIMVAKTKPKQPKLGEDDNPKLIKLSELNEYIFFSQRELDWESRAANAELFSNLERDIREQY